MKQSRRDSKISPTTKARRLVGTLLLRSTGKAHRHGIHLKIFYALGILDALGVSQTPDHWANTRVKGGNKSYRSNYSKRLGNSSSVRYGFFRRKAQNNCKIVRYKWRSKLVTMVKVASHGWKRRLVPLSPP